MARLLLGRRMSSGSWAAKMPTQQMVLYLTLPTCFRVREGGEVVELLKCDHVRNRPANDELAVLSGRSIVLFRNTKVIHSRN